MSNIADRIIIQQDKDGMLRRALERIILLYTDKSHFVYELLQNAEDAGATNIKFIQYPDRLEVMHNGKPFTTLNLQGLCDIGKSDKINNLNQIGEFGVGFKSVFAICENVKLYSNPRNYPYGIDDAVPFAVNIVDFVTPIDIEMETLTGDTTTKFVFPYKVGESFSGYKTIGEIQAAISKKLQNLGITTLLFLKHLEVIEYEICLTEDKIEGEYLLEKEVINDHCYLISAFGVSDKKDSKKEQFEELSYLKFTRKLDKISNRSVDIAFPVQVLENGEYECKMSKKPYVSVYFPTETDSKLNFIVQGPYRTTPNRESIPPDDDDNIMLAQQTAQLLRESLLELRDTNKLNMSFIRVLPLNPRNFDNFNLFYPLYEVVKSLLSNVAIIPSRSGNYVSARCSKIARQEKLANLFSDNLLTALFSDGNDYYWLPTYLTETNKEYEHVYKYFNSELKITVFRPEDLRIYFANNKSFLSYQSNDWLIELYSILENVPAAFAKGRNELNMLTAEIVKTSTGKFVAPYRKTENKQYIPNVFLYSDKIKSQDMHFVDLYLYEKCRPFFDNILQIQKPNEYDFFIKDIERRYKTNQTIDEEQHIFDIKFLLKYLVREECRDDVTRILSEYFNVRCNDGVMRNPYRQNIYTPVTENGCNLEVYFKNIANNYYVDLDFYISHGIDMTMLSKTGVRISVLTYENIIEGTYNTGGAGKQPRWWTEGAFRWKLSVEKIKEALNYISSHPGAKDSVLKSKVLFTLLLENEGRIRGTVNIGGNTPNLYNETAEFVKWLKGDRMFGWNGKWLFTDSFELVSPKNVSKHDISTSIYGKLKDNSIVYELLGFKKTDADKVDELKKQIPQSQLDAFFENELKQRFGLSSDELTKYIPERTSTITVDTGYEYPFPSVKVKNWETLRKHAAEMLCFANPVKYDFAVRRIRVSNRDKEARAYLLNMYKYDGAYRYACQICHDSCGNIEKAQLFKKVDTELDPMNLCVCPNCHAEYNKIRDRKDGFDAELKEKILDITERDVSESDYVSLTIGEYNIWFTQVHFAEIQSLLKLENDVNDPKLVTVKANDVDSDDNVSEEAGLNIYQEYKGKKIKRKAGNMKGDIIDVTDEYLIVKVFEGKDAGKEIKIQLLFITQHPDVYEIF